MKTITQQYVFLALAAFLSGCASRTHNKSQTPGAQIAPSTTQTTPAQSAPSVVTVPAPAMPGAQTAQGAQTTTSKSATITPATSTSPAFNTKQPMPSDVAGLAARIRTASSNDEARAAWSAAYEKKRYYDQIIRGATRSNDPDINYAVGMSGAYNHLMNAADRQEKSPSDPLINVELNAASQIADMTEANRQQATPRIRKQHRHGSSRSSENFSNT